MAIDSRLLPRSSDGVTRISGELVDNDRERSDPRVESTVPIYSSRFPRKFISRTFSIYAFSNAVKVDRVCATSASCCVQGQFDNADTRFPSVFSFHRVRYFIFFVGCSCLVSFYLRKKERKKGEGGGGGKEITLFEKFKRKLCADCSWNDHISATRRVEWV